MPPDVIWFISVSFKANSAPSSAPIVISLATVLGYKFTLLLPAVILPVPVKTTSWAVSVNTLLSVLTVIVLATVKVPTVSPASFASASIVIAPWLVRF